VGAVALTSTPVRPSPGTTAKIVAELTASVLARAAKSGGELRSVSGATEAGAASASDGSSVETGDACGIIRTRRASARVPVTIMVPAEDGGASGSGATPAERSVLAERAASRAARTAG